MRRFLIISHGHLASGMKSSLELIAGKQEDVTAIDAYTEGYHSFEMDLDRMIKNTGTDDELVIFTDIIGGSVTNRVVQTLRTKRTYVISGMNLPLLIEMVLSNLELPVEQAIEESVAKAREQLIYVNPLINIQTDHD